ncbi:GtrA family protein [Candidatus Merdisoma sp. JLR.KK006]|uniref:GtrA family protein n=1 Tax=Candidatus Merdisoma sp. JLR.KK006 TaxID=3112626 RepID=UPI002FF31540
MSDKKKMWFQSLIQFIKFGIVGLSNTLISYVVYLMGVRFGMHYLLASVLGFVISVLNSFYWNNKYVFQQGDEERNLWLTLVKTFMAYASTGLVLANILLYIWVDVLNISEYLGPVINLVITVPLNFVINKLWAFRGKRKGGA